MKPRFAVRRKDPPPATTQEREPTPTANTVTAKLASLCAQHTVVNLMPKPGCEVVGVSMKRKGTGFRLKLAWWPTVYKLDPENFEAHVFVTHHYFHEGYVKTTTFKPDELYTKVRRVFQEADFRHTRVRGHRSEWYWMQGYDPAQLSVEWRR